MGIKLDDIMTRDWIEFLGLMVDIRLWLGDVMIAEYEEESANNGECGNDYNAFSEHGNCSVEKIVLTRNGLYHLDIYIGEECRK